MAEEITIPKLIAAISPDEYQDYKTKEDLKEFKDLIIKEGISKATEKAKPKPCREQTLTYNSPSEPLEPVYFWLLDLMNARFKSVEKLVDNFTSTPTSGQFGEMGMRSQRMQDEAMKILGSVNTIIKSIINLIYDLKEFEIRLKHYEAANSKDKQKAEAGNLALKQIWMDNVDVKKARGSINMLSFDLNFATLRDAFMIINNEKDVDKLDLNDRVKRILKPRILEFIEWKTASEKELIKRFEIEKSYLKSQVSAVQLYTRWVKPYLKAVAQLEQKNSTSPSLVTAFDTVVLELTLLGKNPIDVEEEAIETKNVPANLGKIKFKRKYYTCLLLDFSFRGIPGKAGQHFVFGGRVDVSFKAYALNDEELKMLNQELTKSDFEEALKLAQGVTDESLGQLKEELDHFLEDYSKDKENEKKKDTNPFAALFGKYEKKEEKKKEEKKISKIKPDNYYEKIVREIAKHNAEVICFDIFDIYKKAHGMASHPDPFEAAP